MIKAILILNKKTECLKNFKSYGHAGFGKKGQDIVCSAFTLLVRTGIRVLSMKPGVSVSTNVEKDGLLMCSLGLVIDSETDWLKGVTDMLVQGLNDLALEYPEHVDIEILYEEE